MGVFFFFFRRMPSVRRGMRSCKIGLGAAICERNDVTDSLEFSVRVEVIVNARDSVSRRMEGGGV